MPPSSSLADPPEAQPAPTDLPANQMLPATSPSEAAAPAWHRSTLGIALFGSLLMYLALPPFDLWPLAWLAPIPWLMLIRQPQLTGKRPYRALYLAGFAFWFLTLHWLRLPFWATAFGWLALSIYLAVYVPLFVGLSRIAVHRLRLPLIAAAPLVWMGLELARGHILNGFTMGSLGHTQYRWTAIIQIADLAGAYGVGAAVMFVAACLARTLPTSGRRWALWPLAPAAAMFAAVLAYGYLRLQEPNLLPGSHEKHATVALIQGNIDTKMKSEAGAEAAIYKHYADLTWQALDEARKAGKQVDLIVWPETMFRFSLHSFDKDFPMPPDAQVTAAEAAANSERPLKDAAAGFGHPLLFGVDRMHWFDSDRQNHFNSAVFADPSGKLLGAYDKQLLVMFGEYVPLADRFQWLYKLTPLPGGVTPGREPLSVDVHGLRYSPNICFESVMPHLIAGQVRELQSQGKEPDVLVNLTNDGWFWGSSELDLHLMCGVFRAVECRKPFLIAANTGFSAWIDGSGRLLAQGKRHDTSTILADVEPDKRHSWYLQHGDVIPGFGLALCGLLGLVGLGGRWVSRRAARD